MITVKELSKSYGDKTVFSALSFSVRENVCTAFTGESGIGKTTLLRCVSGLEKADTGFVSGLKGQKKSFVFQENRLLEGISVLDNILCVSRDRERALYYLERVGLDGSERKKASELSGGMKRRLAVARALTAGGDVFFLDEPLRELDETTEDKLIKLLREELSGKTCIMITHEKKHTDELADVILRFSGAPMQLSE